MSESINEFRAAPLAQAAPRRFLWSAGLSLLLLAGSTPVRAIEPLTLKGWELAEGIKQVEQIAFTADSKILAIGCDKGIILWDLEKGKKLDTTFREARGTFHGLAFSPNGKLLIASNGPFTWVFDVATGKTKHTFEGGQKDEVNSIAISPDGKILALSGMAHSATLIDLENYEELVRLEGQKEIVSLAFDKKGETLATASRYGTTVIWDVKKREKLKTLDQSDHSGIGSMAFSADGKTVVTNGNFKGNKLVRAWDVEKGEPRWTYGGKKFRLGEYAAFGYLTLAPDAKTLIFGCGGSVAMFADLDSGDAPEAVPGFELDSTIGAIALSPDGRLLAVVSGNHVKIGDAPKKKKKE